MYVNPFARDDDVTRSLDPSAPPAGYTKGEFDAKSHYTKFRSKVREAWTNWQNKTGNLAKEQMAHFAHHSPTCARPPIPHPCFRAPPDPKFPSLTLP